MKALDHLSRRERQIMDALFRLGEATAADVRAAMPDAPSYSAVRATLKILEDKGSVRRGKGDEGEGRAHLYKAVVSQEAARTSALTGLLDTFFGGSAAQATVALLGSPKTRFTKEDLDRIAQLIEEARRKSK